MQLHPIFAPDLDPHALHDLPRVRAAMLDALLRRLHEGEGHLLIHGPAGSGRGLLLRQLGLAIEQAQGHRWLVVPPAFRPVLRTSDLWLDVARRLSPASFVQALPAEEEARTRLALDVIDGMARVEGRRVLVLWEHLDEDLARLGLPVRAVREVLEGGHALTVVATTAAPLSTAGPVERGLAERFSAMALEPLSSKETVALANALRDGDARSEPMNAGLLGRLTATTTLLGGWPAIVARWVEVARTGDAEADVLAVLAAGADARWRLIRELPSQGRAVLEGLALQEGPRTAHELSAALELDVNAISSQLSRLGRLGHVEARRRPDTGRAAFVVRDRALALWLLARGPGRARLRALAAHLARQTGSTEALPTDQTSLIDDLSRCEALITQSRADETGAPLSRLLEQAVALGLSWSALSATLWPVIHATARQGGGAMVADHLEESAFAVDGWVLIAALKLGRDEVTHLLPEAQAPVLALQDALR